MMKAKQYYEYIVIDGNARVCHYVASSAREAAEKHLSEYPKAKYVQVFKHEYDY